jgi:hypothetical protein
MRARLMLKLYLASLLTAAVVGTLMFSLSFWYRSHRAHEYALIGEHLLSDVVRVRGDPRALEAEMARLEGLSSIRLTVFRLDGTLLASSAKPALAAPTADELSRATEGEGVQRSAREFVMPVRDGAELAAIGVVSSGSFPSGGMATAFLLQLGLLLISAFVFARHLVRPLERIGSAAQRFGQGRSTRWRIA